MSLRAQYELSPAQIRLLLRVYRENVGTVYRSRAAYWYRPVRCKAPVGHALSRQGLGRTQASEAGWEFLVNDTGLAVARRVRQLFSEQGWKRSLHRLVGDHMVPVTRGRQSFVAEVPYL